MAVADLELDLDVFAGPFDLLLTLVLREEIDLLEVDLAEIVLTYLDHLEARGELDLEVATEFLVLIAALLELKSRLMLAREDDDLPELEPGEAAEELLARMLAHRRYRRAADELVERLRAQEGYRFRSAPGARRAAPGLAAGARRRVSTTRRSWAWRWVRSWPIRRRSTSSTCTSCTRAYRWPPAWPTCARCWRGAASASTRRCAGPTACRWR